MSEVKHSPEVLFSNLNLPPREVLLKSAAAIIELAKDCGYDGVEYTTSRSRSMDQLITQRPYDGIRSFHESWPFSSQPNRSGRLMNFADNLKYSLAFPPSEVGSLRPSTRLIRKIQQSQGYKPIVVFPESSGIVEDDRRKVRILGSSDVSFQPNADVYEAWRVGSVDDFLAEAKARNLKICFDTFHARRRSAKSGKSPNLSWEDWLPEAIKRGQVSRAHISGYRNEQNVRDPVLVRTTNSEMNELVFSDGKISGDFAEMLDLIKDGIGHKAISSVVIEMPYAGARSALRGRDKPDSASDVAIIHKELVQNTRGLFFR